jgi:hypothetical protein
MSWPTRVFAWFGRRKPALRFAEPNSGPPPDHPAQPIVRWSAVEAAQSGGEPYDLVQAIIDFVNAMSEQGLYMRAEIVGRAVQAYYARSAGPDSGRVVSVRPDFGRKHRRLPVRDNLPAA